MSRNQKVQRLLRQFRVEKARHPKYRDPEFVAVYLEHCEAELFDDARRGLEKAKLGCELAERVSKPEGAALLVRAHAVLGSAHRRSGDLEASQEAYDRAFVLADRLDIPLIERAHLLNRVTILRICQTRLPEALELSNQAVFIYEEEDSPYRGEALVNRGQVYVHRGQLEAGIVDFGRVLQSTNPRSNHRVYQSALHNLSYALTQAGTLHAGQAFAYIRRARQCIRGHERSIPRAKLRWIEGLAYRALHMNARAEPLLEGAYKALVRLEAPYDAALVALDLVEIFLLEGRSARAVVLLEEAIGRLPRESGETVGALRGMIEACRYGRASRDLLVLRGEVEEMVFRVRGAQSARF